MNIEYFSHWFSFLELQKRIYFFFQSLLDIYYDSSNNNDATMMRYEKINFLLRLSLAVFVYFLMPDFDSMSFELHFWDKFVSHERTWSMWSQYYCHGIDYYRIIVNYWDYSRLILRQWRCEAIFEGFFLSQIDAIFV